MVASERFLRPQREEGANGRKPHAADDAGRGLDRRRARLRSRIRRGRGVVSGAGVAVCAGSDGAAVLIASFPSTPAAGEAANRMMALARLYFMDETWRAVVIPPRAL